MEEGIYSIPKVTIDLAEYQELQKAVERLSKKADNSELEALKIIAGTLYTVIAGKQPEIITHLTDYIKFDKGFIISVMRDTIAFGHFNNKLILKKIENKS